jgi:hypothetical protein
VRSRARALSRSCALALLPISRFMRKNGKEKVRIYEFETMSSWSGLVSGRIATGRRCSS